MRRTITFPQWLADLLERAGSTAVQAAAVVLLAAPTLDAAGAEVAAIAGIAAGIAVVKTAATGWLASGPRNHNVLVDTAERAGWTFVEVFAGAVIVTPGDGSTWKLAVVSGAAAALAVVKGVLATYVGLPTTAAMLPASLDPAE